MYLLVTKEDIIVSISDSIERMDDGIYVKEENCIYAIDVSVFDVASVPQEVVAHDYCYTPEIGFYPYEKKKPDPIPKSDIEILKEETEALKKENILLKAQNQALTDRTDFHEDLIAEIAMIVYK